MNGAEQIGFFAYQVLGPLFLGMTAAIGAFTLSLVIVVALRETTTAS